MSDVQFTQQSEVVLRFFKKKYGLKAERADDPAGDVIKAKLLQWGNDLTTFRVKTSDSYVRNVSFKKEDLDNVDGILFLMSRTAWAESYLVKASALRNMLDADGNGKLDIAKADISSYLFFDLKTANGWQS